MDGFSSPFGGGPNAGGSERDGIPRQIGKYRVEAKIGGGGFGVVYRALDPDLERPVAIKQLTLTLDAETRERFLREARIAAGLKHPNIVAVYEFGVDENRPYLVLELIEGANLSDLLASGQKLPISKKLEILVQIADALSYVHEKEILHRDIKPQNIVLDALGHAKLLDFGISKNPKLKSHQLTLHASFGTPGYAAPEIILGEDASRQSDLFSFGALAFELLSGHPAFPGKSTSEINQKVVRGERQSLASWNPQLAARVVETIESCLNLSPDARPRDFRWVRDVLRSEAEAASMAERLAANTPTVRESEARSRGGFMGAPPFRPAPDSEPLGQSGSGRESPRPGGAPAARSKQGARNGDDGGFGHPRSGQVGPGSAAGGPPRGKWPMRFNWKTALLVAGALVVLVLLVFFVKVGKAILDFYHQFDEAIALLHQEFGINQYLAKAIAALLLAPSALGFGRGLLRKEGRRKYVLASSVYTAVFFSIIYIFSRNAAFSHRTGEARLWCAETPEGLRCFDSPGFDPKYGIALKAITPEWKLIWERRNLGQVATKVDLGQLDELIFFDPLTGAARYWYHRKSDGTYTLYDQPGFDADTGAELQPVSRDVVAAIRQWRDGLKRSEQRARVESERQKVAAAEDSFRSKYLRPGVGNPSAVSLLVFGASGALKMDLEAALRQALTSQGVSVVDPFRSDFIKEGLARRLADGDRELLRRLNLASACRGVLVVDVAVEDRGGYDGLSVAEALAELRFLASGNGEMSPLHVVREKGGGNSAEHARKEAMAALARAVGQMEIAL